MQNVPTEPNRLQVTPSWPLVAPLFLFPGVRLSFTALALPTILRKMASGNCKSSMSTANTCFFFSRLKGTQLPYSWNTVLEKLPSLRLFKKFIPILLMLLTLLLLLLLLLLLNYCSNTERKYSLYAIAIICIL